MLPHILMFSGSNPSWGLSVWSLHVFREVASSPGGHQELVFSHSCKTCMLGWLVMLEPEWVGVWPCDEPVSFTGCTLLVSQWYLRRAPEDEVGTWCLQQDVAYLLLRRVKSHLLSSSVRASDWKKVNKLLKKAGSVLGTILEPLKLILQWRILYKIKMSWTTLNIL